MLETNQLYESARQQIGAKELADAMNVGLQHVYKLCADPLALDAPVRNDIDRIGAVVSRLAAKRNAKPALVLWRLAFEEMFANAVDHEECHPLADDEITSRIGRLCKEFGETLEQVRPGYDPDALAREASQVIAELERIVRSAERKDDTQHIAPRQQLRPVS